MLRMAAVAVLGVALCVPLPTMAEPSVQARGLMRGMAVLEIDGAQRILRVGQSSPEGVELLAATPREARIRIGERERVLTLSSRVGGGFQQRDASEVRVARDTQGHFRVAGAINGRPVRFLVDTGATILAMSSEQAEALGLRYLDSGRQGQVTTASGQAVSHFVLLDAVSIGGIEVSGVQAAVVEGAYPVEILLGMSFLNHVSMAENQGVLTLTEKY